jgi:exosortase A-associated hydrolase 2
LEKPTEKPFFFENERAKLFGFLHFSKFERRMDSSQQRRGVVFCHPFAEEKAISHRVIVNFARTLCQRGYHILRFDYRGCGDSEGDFEGATLTTCLADTKRAIDVLQEHTGADQISLFGLRLGGTVAALAAAKDPRVKSVILWEPITQVRAYFDQFLRMQVLAENSRENRLVGTRRKLLQDLQEGRSVDILGYLLSSRCYKEFVNVDLPFQFRNFDGPTLIVAIGRRQRQRKDLQALVRQGDKTQVTMLYAQRMPFWIDLRDTYRELASWQGHLDLFEKTTDWLDNTLEKLQ